MSTPNYPQQPGPYTPPQGGQQQYPPAGGQQYPPSGGQPAQHYTPPGGQQLPPPYTPPGGQQLPPQYGQPPAGGPPPPGYPPAPTGQPAKSGGAKKIVLIVIGVIVLGIIVGGVIYFQKKSPAGADAGDCIKVNNASASNADVEKIDCNTAEAVYKVGKKLDSNSGSCPDGDYVEYSESGSSDLKLCLMLNAKEGDCFKESTQQDTRSDCAAADYKVSKIIPNSSDSSGCGADDASNALTYAEPATVICRVAAGA